MSNPFKAMDEMYETQVKENDENGYAELYKTTFLNIQQYLKAYYNLVIEDVKYLDGYFIFGTGTNSVIHFKFKGAKQWQFGLWWTVITKDNMRPTLQAEIFCQHLRHIDKFKPSRSEFCKTVSFIIQDDNTIRADDFEPYNYELNQIGKMCKFIHNHNYVAWYKDWYGIDYNTVKQKPVEAFFLYYLDGFRTWWRQSVEGLLNHLMLGKLKKCAHTSFDNTQYKYEIKDYGDNTSPRYELQVEVPDDDEQKTGCYGLFETDEEESAWKNYKRKAEKLGKILGVKYWYSEVSECIIFWNKKELDEYWSEEDNEGENNE